MSFENKNLRHLRRNPSDYPAAASGQAQKDLSTDQTVKLTVALDEFFTDLPPSSLVPFVRQRVWLPDPNNNDFPLNGGANAVTFKIFDVPDNQSVLLTYVAQTWLRATTPTYPPAAPSDENTIYTALPTTAGISGVAPLQLTINQNPIADAAGIYNDANFTDTSLAWYPLNTGANASGFIEQQVNVLDLGVGQRLAIVIPENQAVGALYTATYGTQVAAAEKPDAIKILCKGFIAPTKVIQKARKLYGI